MPPLPLAYRWLSTINPPRMITEGLQLFDAAEARGAADNPLIIAWAKEVGGDVARSYRADSIAWCGLFMALVARRAGKLAPAAPFWALSWKRFGVAADRPALGDVLVFIRPGGGHVGLYVGEDAAAFHVLGGNQSDRVSFTRIAKDRLYAARRPAYRAVPASVKPYILAATGALSQNET